MLVSRMHDEPSEVFVSGPCQVKKSPIGDSGNKGRQEGPLQPYHSLDFLA